MLKIISGVPGSGKTYWAVNHISTLFKKWQTDGMMGKEVPQEFPVLHNIEQLKIGKTFDAHEQETGATIRDLFSYSWHEKNKNYRGYLFVVDEAQSLFRKRYNDTDGFLFFEKHRHLGIDIILLTQDYKLVCPDITLHQELHLRAVSDTANPVPFFFAYQKMVGWEAVGREFLRKKKSIFALYQTADFDQEKTRKKARPMMILIMIAVVCSVLGLFVLRKWTTGMQSSSSPSPAATTEEKQQSPLDKITEKIRDSRNTSSQSSSTTMIETYPQSLLDEYQGAIIRLSVLVVDNKKQIFYGDMILSEDEFPYPVFRSASGYYASIVPLDILEYNKTLIQQRKMYDNVDPNQGWYYQDSKAPQSQFQPAGGG